MRGNDTSAVDQTPKRSPNSGARRPELATGIDDLVAILPTLQRLTEIVDPLDNTVVRLGRFVDRLPGGRRTQRSPQP